MRTAMTLLCLLALTSSAQAVEPVAESPHTDIGYPTPAAALEALRAKPGVKIREENGWVVVNDPSENTFWSIAAAGNPTYPSAVKRTLVEEGGRINLRMKVLCGAEKSICDQLVRQFQEINANMAKSLHP